MTNSTKKILITGPESSGKSSLSTWLSDQLNCPLNPEYAREYLNINGPDYTQSDLPKILTGQLANEQNLLATHPAYLICDTGPEVIYIWNKVAYQKPIESITQSFKAMQYDLILLLYPDLDWQEDPLREFPSEEKRLSLFQIYQETLAPFHPKVIKGSGENRFLSAMKYILEI